jgi:ABC-type cobalamin/Fe3+-siderophores transport system ATPase subunit
VCVLGARQAGKSTLVRAIAEREHPARYVTLDDPGTVAGARSVRPRSSLPMSRW